MIIMDYIELHGADRGETLLIAKSAIQAILPVMAIRGAPAGAKCQVFILGAAFFVTDSYEDIRSHLTNGIWASISELRTSQRTSQ